MKVKTGFLCDVSIRLKYLGKHENAEVTVSAAYGVCRHLYSKQFKHKLLRIEI